jgi:hypothetical protein
MAAVVFLRPKTRKGREILERLEETKVKRMPVIEDGTRRYYLDGKDADADALDPMLDRIDLAWRDHVTNSTPN